MYVSFKDDLMHFCFCRGKGDNFRLGHGREEHVRHPRLVEGLTGRRVVWAAVGALHCLVLTDEGQVLGWGKNEQGQLGDHGGSFAAGWLPCSRRSQSTRPSLASSRRCRSDWKL